MLPGIMIVSTIEKRDMAAGIEHSRVHPTQEGGRAIKVYIKCAFLSCCVWHSPCGLGINSCFNYMELVS